MAATTFATCPSKSVLVIRRQPEFSIGFWSYAGGAENWRQHAAAQKRSLTADTLQTS